MSNSLRIGVVGTTLTVLGVGVFLAISRWRGAPAIASLPTIVRVSADHWIVPERLRDDYIRDPQRLNREFRLKPVEGDKAGEIRSLVVDYVGDGSPMFEAGFRKGDRILEVNGSPVTTLSRALSLVQEIQGRDVLTVRVEQQGSSRAFRCEFPTRQP